MRNFELDNQRQLNVMSWRIQFYKKYKNINIISPIIEYVQFLVKSRTKDNWYDYQMQRGNKKLLRCINFRSFTL